ncbi:hypothetical protein KIF59_21080 [Enterobacter cloacae subsp. cloacae]|nr:hypothetical protein [Enterobacter cloacae subsp. cloacae]
MNDSTPNLEAGIERRWAEKRAWKSLKDFVADAFKTMGDAHIATAGDGCGAVLLISIPLLTRQSSSVKEAEAISGTEKKQREEISKRLRRTKHAFQGCKSRTSREKSGP